MKPLAILLPFTLLSSAAMAQQRVKVDAVADRTAVKPGETITVALAYTIDPGWHIYWTNPGETGTPPKAKWQKSAAAVGEPQFPVPERMHGPVTAFGYEKQTAVLYTVTVPADAKSAVELQAIVSWVVCSDETCVSERQSVAISVPLGDGQPNRPDAFAAWRAAQPQRPTPPQALTVSFKPDGKHGVVELPVAAGDTAVDFFPPKSDGLEFAKPKLADGKWVADFRILDGADEAFAGTGVVVIKKANSENRESHEVRVAYRLPKPSSKE